MGGRALRALTSPRLTLHRLLRHSDRCRFVPVAITHLHTHTVRPTTDRPTWLASHSVSLLHAHLVFVTKYRRPVCTGQILTFCQHTMRVVCAELDVELVEFNGEPDHVHLRVAYPPTLAISTLVQRLEGRTAYAVRPQHTSACARPRMRGHL
jgi:putative transposase